MKIFSALLTPLPCALLFCLANAWKPAMIDDLAYIWYARQIVETPAQPFGPPPDGFRLIWYDEAQPAFTLLTPMAVPYWLALGIALFGENLVLLKLWQFPFCLLFTASLSALLKRYAPGYDKPLLAMTVFSPAFLPSLNVMVDVPAQALSLTAIALFHRAVERSRSSPVAPRPEARLRSRATKSRTRWWLVIAAGLVAGVAMQTKYTGATSNAVILIYAVLNRRWAAGPICVFVASSVFCGWEGYLAHVYGRSHFLDQIAMRRSSESQELLLPLFGILGSVGMIFIPLILAGLRCSRTVVRWALVYLAIGFLLMTVIPGRWATIEPNPNNSRDELSISTLFLGINGAAIGALVPVATAYLGFRGWSRQRIRLRRNATAWFLIGWLVAEVTAYFLLSPFPAARRVMGVTVAITMLVGRLLSLTRRDESSRRLITVIAAFGVALGALFSFTDYRDALVEKEAVIQSVKLIRGLPGGDRPIWFCGHWGFQYYGELERLKTLYPGESILNEGDWLIYPNIKLRPDEQELSAKTLDSLEQVAVIEQYECWPLRTVWDLYLGSPSIRRHDGPRLQAAIYRARKEILTMPKKSD